MAQLDPEKWAKNLAANPPPSWGSDPEQWPAEIDYTGNDFGRAYGFSVLLFAERWADEMERRLAERPELSVADVAEVAEHTANQSLGRFGMTGFQYGCAVSLLSQCWVHGDELRRWHNLRTQIRDEGERANAEGGILNPALLTLEPRAPGELAHEET